MQPSKRKTVGVFLACDDVETESRPSSKNGRRDRAKRKSMSSVDIKDMKSVVLKRSIENWVIETENLEAIPNNFKMDLQLDIYNLHFSKEDHFNWVGQWTTSPMDYFVVSVLAMPYNKFYRCLQNSKTGFDEFQIPEEFLKKEKDKDNAENLPLRIEKYLMTLNTSIKLVRLKKRATTR